MFKSCKEHAFDRYTNKFRYMVIDPQKNFRTALRDALHQTPNSDRFPSVMKLKREDEQQALESLSRDSVSDSFFMEEPRTEFESKTRSERDHLRLEYPEKKAEFQFALQKRTSHLTLTMAPTIQHMTPLQLKASRVQEIKAIEKATPRPKYTILEESQVNNSLIITNSVSDVSVNIFSKPTLEHHASPRLERCLVLEFV